ncbi:MAG: glycosyltransferase [Promethearchaeota archaeon]
MKRKLICLENLPYHSYVTIGSHHYVKYFMRDFEVLWISLPWHPFQLLKNPKNDRIRNWNFNRPLKLSNSLYIFTPFTFLPYRNNFFVKSSWYLENYYKFIPGLIKKIKKIEFSSPDIMWFDDPRHFSIIKYLNAKRIYYRCVDDLQEFNDVPKSLAKYEIELIKISDAVFFTSKNLMDKFKNLNKNSYYLPNGCDFERFYKVEDDSLYKKINKYFYKNKINILYMGTIAEWFDFNVIEWLAKNKNFNLIIVGPKRVKIPKSLKKNNIVFTGPYPYEYMPYFVKKADIGIIPFKINKITDSVSPVKLYEYLAGGLPTVASGFKNILELKDVCFIYNSIEDIDDAIEKAINASKDTCYIKKIINFAKQNSWESRYQFIKTFLER